MLERDGICEHCGKPILKKYDCVGHHIKPLTIENLNDKTVSLNPKNILLSHMRCHNELECRFEGFTQRVYLVWGSPCSGKTTFVKEVANPDDFIIDMDSIWELVSNSERYCKPSRLNKVVFAVRDCLMDTVRMRIGMWRNAWIIGGFPLSTERKRLADIYGAEIIHIDTSEDICLSRAKDRPADWENYVRDYWKKIQE